MPKRTQRNLICTPKVSNFWGAYQNSVLFLSVGIIFIKIQNGHLESIPQLYIAIFSSLLFGSNSGNKADNIRTRRNTTQSLALSVAKTNGRLSGRTSTTSFFLTSTAFVDTNTNFDTIKTRIRHTSFEIYRILAKLSFSTQS